MKFLLKLIVAIASLVGIALIIALFVNKSYTVERTYNVQTSQTIAFAFFSNAHNIAMHSTSLEENSDTEIWVEGYSGEIGQKVCWKSKDKQIGAGELELVALEPDEQLDFQLRLKSPQKMDADVILRTTGTDEETTHVRIQVTGEIPYPWNLSLLFMDVSDEIGKVLDENMKNITTDIEKSANE
jgi:hypothetical protein